ncbi:MAG: hypothetical protein ACJAY5_001456 [Actinomycetes bacterium]
MQLRDVITGNQVPGGVRDDSVAQVPPGLFEPPECVHPDDAVDIDSANLLEGADRGVNHVVEYIGFTVANVEKPEALKAVSDFCDYWITSTPCQMERGAFDWCLGNHCG